MAGLGANGRAVSPRDRRRVCHWTGGEAHRRHAAVRARPPHGSDWVDAVVDAVARRVPFWSLLIGVYIAAGFWTLPPNIANALDKGCTSSPRVADVSRLGSARQARPHARTGARLLPPDDHAHRESRPHRRRDARPAGRPERPGAVDYADSDRARRRRPRHRAGAAGHARQSVCRPDGREADPHRQLHPALVGRRGVPRRHRLAREPAAAAVEQHRARAEREAFAIDRHQLPLARAGAGRDVRGKRRLQERSRSCGSHHRRSGARRHADRAGRRPRLRTRRAIPHARRSGHRLLGDPAVRRNSSTSSSSSTNS